MITLLLVGFCGDRDGWLFRGFSGFLACLLLEGQKLLLNEFQSLLQILSRALHPELVDALLIFPAHLLLPLGAFPVQGFKLLFRIPAPQGQLFIAFF